MKYETPDFSSEGIEIFQKNTIHNQDFLHKLEMYGAYQSKEIAESKEEKIKKKEIEFGFDQYTE